MLEAIESIQIVLPLTLGHQLRVAYFTHSD